MTKRGRPRLSDEEKKAKGTYKPSRGSGDEVAEVAMVLTAGRPTIELNNSEAIELWETVTTHMIGYKIMAEIDVTMISMMCVEYDTYLDCLSKPIVDVAADGTFKPSAYYQIRAKSLTNIMKIAGDLGLTPLLRMKIRTPKEKKSTDPAQKFFK